jgi:deoxyribose-phosphate aldolase
MKAINNYIDHTLLLPTATPKDIKRLCDEALAHNLYGVCINGYYTRLARSLLLNSNVKVITVVGFPLGASDTQVKKFETKQCIKDGADEIDMVINIGELKSGNGTFVQKEIEAIKKIIDNKTLKVIVETCHLTTSELKTVCKLVMNSGADFIKTSTGFGTSGATLEDIKLIKNEIGNTLKIKASGGIKTYQEALKYIEMGVARIGTSSGKEMVLNNTI